MRKWILPLFLVLSVLLPGSVHAQVPITFDSMIIEIWPEYDKPTVLVIYQMTLPATTTYPASVAVRIPTNVGEPNAVAERNADGTLLSIEPTRTVSGEWATISFITTFPEIQLEYYDPGLIKNGVDRHYQFTWSGDYAISHLTIQVQQPVGATDMRISPSLGSGITGSYNLVYYNQDLGSISAGQNISITLDYKKSDETLSAQSLPVESSAPISQGTSTDLNLSTWWPWILGILGAGLIVGGILWFIQSGRQHPSPATRRRRSRVGDTKAEPQSTSAEHAVYCSQCGKRALPGDQFCRSCGSPIRSK